MPQSPHRVVILGFPPAQMLDVTGPLEVLAAANTETQFAGQPPCYDIVLAGPEAGPLATTAGVPLLASHSLFDPGLAADTLLISGGRGARLAAGDPRQMVALAALCERVPRVGSICTGAFPLAATGWLDQRRATTHWAHFDEFAERFPAVTVDRDALFVSDGKFHTAAGVSAGIDFTLALVEQDFGRQLALQVARDLVVFLKRPGGQAQFSVQLAAQVGGAEADQFLELTRWMAAHLAADLSVERLAERAAMSVRNFARRFTAAMKVTPGQYVQQLRIDAARRLLTDSDLSITRVADRCGFPSAEAMRVAFQRQLKVAPIDFRARFRSAKG